MQSRGCELCHLGAKMVLFVTGLCNRNCWYCPISADRRGQDLIFANEREISTPEEAIREAEVMSALGSSITGGEPLLVLDRVILYSRALKDAFGREHHIHLYTGAAPGDAELHALRGVVDEIRLHPPPEEWGHIGQSSYLRSVIKAKELGFSAGFEIPSLKGVADLVSALPGLDFLNINELEWGEISAEEMRRRGLTPVDGIHNAVRGSAAWAKDLAGHPKVHFCPSRFKDSVQLRERLKRIARNTARPFDEITPDGTIRYGVIELRNGGAETCLPLKKGAYQVIGDHVEADWRIVRKYSRKLPGKKFIVERYPNRGIVVEVIPL